ncbi:MAG: DedA family protein [Acidobacteria bacterium]|nr:MAG: DedA family protein [Acidobacteriota bacterium]
MAQHLVDLLRSLLAHYGYGAVAGALLLENAGLPVPGETVLLLASFLAFSEHRLRLPYIILVGIFAATIGDNIGFAVGVYGGRPLLERYRKTLRIRPATISRGEDLFRRYGAATVFVARFITGMRVIAGPLAGVLRMDWRKFVIFNFLGAALWVTVISSAGFLFGKHWDDLVEILRDANVAVVAGVCILLAILWWRRRRRVQL